MFLWTKDTGFLLLRIPRIIDIIPIVFTKQGERIAFMKHDILFCFPIGRVFICTWKFWHTYRFAE
jgi:hypothetical protein